MNYNHKTVRKMTAADEAGRGIAKTRAVVSSRGSSRRVGR